MREAGFSLDGLSPINRLYRSIHSIVYRSPNLHCFGLWEETDTPRGNQYRHKENKLRTERKCEPLIHCYSPVGKYFTPYFMRSSLLFRATRETFIWVRGTFFLRILTLKKSESWDWSQNSERKKIWIPRKTYVALILFRTFGEHSECTLFFKVDLSLHFMQRCAAPGSSDTR